MSLKFWYDFTIFDHPVRSNPKKSRPPNILFYERSSLHPSRSVIVFIWSSFTKKSQGTKYGDQNVHFFDVTPYINFTHPVFLRLYWHIWHPWNISFPTIYNIMGVKCTHYKLCSVQSKLVYFSQFWGMKHFFRTSLWHMTNGQALSNVLSKWYKSCSWTTMHLCTQDWVSF